jgi:hypothetical protein
MRVPALLDPQSGMPRRPVAKNFLSNKGGKATMKRMICAASLCLLALSPALAGAAEGNLNSSLHGDYAFSGEAFCLTSPNGFSNFRALPPSSIITFTVQGVRHFNGDGTGTILKSRSVSINPDENNSGQGPVSVSEFYGTFKYTVAPDHSIHVEQDPLTTTVILGPNPGASEIWTDINFDGYVSEDFKTITAATPGPTPAHPGLAIEFGHNPNVANSPTMKRACHRSRIMVKIGGGEARDHRLSANPFLRP